MTSRDIRAVFHLLRQYTGASQTQIAIACGMTQGKVSETMKKGGRQVTTLEVFERIADGLHMPDTARMTLGIAPRAHPSASAVSVPQPRPRTATPPAALADAKPAPSQTGELAATDDISRLTRWLTVSDTTDETIEGLARSTSSLATAHTQVPAKRLLPQVLHLHR
ncbi:helix-turn-helix domain-containing protein [Actinomadura sp. BRA 177]|uniref:helix-turn-helix domain-containing protein n=1 Tax=Actinomadura sp. BRA 177 TaxID=2745202 RepID=UPI0020CD7439|nr:helix-turn-helix domain-containing protein [Actinomadura sp. BRA 177]